MKKEGVHKHPINRHNWSVGQKIADKLATFSGSWGFILFLIFFIIIWVIFNVYEILKMTGGGTFDPYPFIFLNLVIGIVTATISPIILMAQNRAGQRDRIRAEYDYEINKKAEREIEEIKKQLDRIERKLK